MVVKTSQKRKVIKESKMKTYQIFIDGELECEVFADSPYQAEQQYLQELDISAIEKMN